MVKKKKRKKELDLLTIPSFLRRSKLSVPLPSTERAVETSPLNKTPPASYHRYEIHNGSEIRLLGSGRRFVWAKRGRKWAFIWRGEGHNRIRLRLKVFDNTVVKGLGE